MRKFVLALIFLVLIAATGYTNIQKSRNFDFEYQVIVKDIPKDAKELKIWIPHLPDNDHQIVQEVSIHSTEEYVINEDAQYKNKMLAYTLMAPFKDEYQFDVRYKIKRLEYSRQKKDEQLLSDFLGANKLVTLSPRIKELASEITKGKESTLDKAQAIYDYVFENVSYDKTVPGWGQGDTERVCDIKSGNCTDFHSLFISLSRASGIPARFFIGAPFEAGSLSGETTKYHCWAEFYDEQIGWIPVDISEAWKDRSKVKYYFGSIDENRLEFSMGRDITLEPKQLGGPLNYFVYPYAEVDGKIFKNIGVLFKYKENQSQKT